MFFHRNFFSFIKINIEVVRTRVRVWVRDYTRYPVGMGWEKSLIPVGFGYGNGDEFFMRGWVWDSETRPRPAPLSSLKATLSILFVLISNYKKRI